MCETERKQALERNSERCDECGEWLDMWQTQFLEDGYDYIEWVCQNDGDCGFRDSRELYHNDPRVQSELLEKG
jgi:alpha-amylase/alpha-mannosidase (GH57 family)